MSKFAVKKNQVPETVTVEGTAKRNIIRRGSGNSLGSKGGGNAAGQTIDDGSLYEDPSALDEKDPNYDSEEETGRGNIPTTAPLARAAADQQHLHHHTNNGHGEGNGDIGKAKLTLTQFKKRIQPVINEFLSSFVVEDVAISLQEIAAPEYSYEFVKRLINTAIDRTDHEREQVSQLLSILYPDLLSSNMIEKGFERLFEIIDEIELDAPLAKNILACFLARAVVDEVIPPSFLSDSVVCNLGGEIIDTARLLLSRDHAGAKLEKIWGPGDGRPVEEMKVAVDQLLGEYILSSDIDEAIRCLNELNEPQFYHEVIKRAVVLSMDKTNEQRKLIGDLFQELSSIQLLTYLQAEKGFQRLYDSLPDLILDTPHAKTILDEFAQRAIEEKVVSVHWKIPNSTTSK